MKTISIGRGIELLHGDAFKLLPQLRCGVVITDPPFSDRTHQGARTNKLSASKKLVTFDSFTDDQFKEFATLCLSCAERWVIMNCDHRHAALTFDWAEHIRHGAWVKLSPMPQITGDRPGSGHETLLALHRQGKKHWNGRGKPFVYITRLIKGREEKILVPTQKPLALVKQLVLDFTDPDELVIDPCAGSGTTAEACIEMGRRCIVIEKDESRFKLLHQRLLGVCSKPRLFE